MAYIINKTNGEQLLIIEDGTLNTETSLGLLGKNTIGYGEVQNENFVKLLENFAGAAPPSGRILTGQIYFNTTTNQINAYDGAKWNVIGDAKVTDNPPDTTIQGSFWIKSNTQQLYVYNNGWKLIGPEVAPNFGTTRATSRVIKDNQNGNHPIVEIRVNDIVIAICSSTFFTIGSENPIPGFSVLKSGINLSSSVDLKGNVDGNSASATRLVTKRKINGVEFDGTEDITVSASSPAPLNPGNYIVGNAYDGSVQTSWTINASSAMAASTIVARDEQGNFAANSITANLVGNVSGNVNTISGTSQFNDVVAKRFEGNFTGPLSGNSATTTKLVVERKINNVGFDGTKDITIKAVSPNSIVPGSFIRGQSYDGSNTAIWDIEASSDTQSNKIVLRDNVGNFSSNIITANSFVGGLSGNVSATTGTSNFNNIIANQVSGNFVGNLTGVASSANRLAVPRMINSVNFDGTQNITIRANTPNAIIAGTHLIGNNFDGSAPVTWTVDAVSGNQSNKIVLRDSSGNFSAGRVTADLTGNVTGNVSGNVTGTLTGDSIGTHYGTVIGNVTGNVTGSSSANVLKTGDTMTGDLSITKPNAWLTLDSPSDNDNGNWQGAGISIGESGYKGSASLHITYTGDGFGHIGMGPVNTSTGIPDYRAMRMYYLNNNVDFFGTITAPTVSATNLSGNGSGITSLNASQLTSGTVSADRLSGNYNIDISGSAANNVAKTGDTMSGYLTLVGSPVNTNHAATKGYVDAVASQSAYTITYGNTQYAVGYTNQVGSWNNGSNYFDVFPPAGKSIDNLVAFIPSIAVIHYAGGVNGDDSMRCTWSWVRPFSFFGSGTWRIRVWVQNTEQRSTPAANWLAIWR